MKVIEKHIVSTTAPMRLSDYAVGKFQALPSRKGVKKAIEKLRVFVDGSPGSTGQFVENGQELSLLEGKTNPVVFEKKLEVLLEDEHLALVVKPAGMATSGNQTNHLANALSFNLSTSPEPDALPRPLPAHRLDYATSGLVLIGKTASCLTRLTALFADRKIKKTYFAIAAGHLADAGQIETPIEGKKALTAYTVEHFKESKKYGGLNLVKLNPNTGRRHQLRIHLSGLGAPIVGDREYGTPETHMKGQGMFLFARSLRFEHPVSGELIEVSGKWPRKFLKLFPECSDMA